VEKQSVFYTECVFVALGIQHANRMPHYLWPVRPYYIYIFFSHYLTNGTIFEKKNVFEHKMCLAIFSTIFLWNIFRRVRKTARSDYQFSHICPSVRMGKNGPIFMKIDVSVFQKSVEKSPVLLITENKNVNVWSYLGQLFL